MKRISLILIVLVSIMGFSATGFAEDTAKLTELHGKLIVQTLRLDGQLQYVNYLIEELVKQKVNTTMEREKLIEKLNILAKQIEKSKEIVDNGGEDNARTGSEQTD